MDILLIAGLWLDRSVWKEVARALETHGHRAVAIALPGQGDGNTSATLADQQAAVIASVDAAAGRPMVVGHSAACSLAWLAADARPDKILKLALIGGFPPRTASGMQTSFPCRVARHALPGLGPFGGPDSADLDDAAKQTIASAAIPVPEGVARGVVRLAEERRYDVPVVLVCPEFSPTQAKGWIEDDEAPELVNAKFVSFVDIDSGHWPMMRAPVELARLLAETADQS
jgi:pimeloyl-ACP methyl ester carboxylesterase